MPLGGASPEKSSGKAMENLTGKQLGPYQIVSAIGEGGMAAVYKAYQPAMERYVALKILPRHFADDPRFVSRFQREAKILAKLQHPHILPVFDFGAFDGYTYLVMPFVESGTLAAWLTGRPLPLPQIGGVISQVGDALDYAHTRGLVHRDVKPSNVLMDERGNCLLTDFGLAKIAEGAVKLTASGTIIGTPAYMSPEQGMGQALDHRSDIYSLGVVMYEISVGRVPYNAETPIAVVFKHINDPLPLPRAVNPELPDALECIILKALAKQPEDRYATAGDMVRALQTALAGPLPKAGVVRPPTETVSLGSAGDTTAPGEPAQPEVTRQYPLEGSSATHLRPAARGLPALPRWAFIAGGLLLVVCIGLAAAMAMRVLTSQAPAVTSPTASPVANIPAAVLKDYSWDFTPCNAQDTSSWGTEVFDPGRVFGGGWVGNGCAVRFFTGGQSWMEATFTVNPDPQSGTLPAGAWSLRIYHLSSSPDGVQAGYSPVQVTLNGQPAWKGSPGSTDSGPGGLWAADESDVSKALQLGSNTLRWSFLNGASTHYWLKSFHLAWSPPSK